MQEPIPIETSKATEVSESLPETSAEINPTLISDENTEPVAPLASEQSPPKDHEKDMEEPQNDLTRKFTEAEWKALKEFRKFLPEIFAEAYRDKETKLTNVTLWGVTLETTGPPNARASVILMKFLRARNLSIPDAKTMLIATLRWREEFKVQECVQEKFDEGIFGKLGHVYGRDKGGRPVTYNLYGANQDLKAVFGDVQRFIRWRVALMERSMTELDFETVDQMVQIHDYEGVTLSSRDANSKAAASEATNIFQSHYPEFVYKKYFVNVPRFLTWIFWIFRSLVSSQTFAKMSVVGSGPQIIGKELLPIIDAKELPKRYGGEADAF